MNYLIPIRALIFTLILSSCAVSVYSSDYVLSHLSQLVKGQEVKTHDCFLMPLENGPTVTESAGTFNVYQGRSYSFKFKFSLHITGDEPQTHSIEALLRKGWKISVPASAQNTYQVTGARQNANNSTFFVKILAEPFFGDNIGIELRDEKGKVYGTAVFNFKVLHPNPDNNVSATMRRFDPVIQILYARRGASQSPGVELVTNQPCTLNVNLARAVPFDLQMKRENLQNGKMYSFYINPDNDFGYRVQYQWVGRYPPGVLPILKSNNLQFTLRSAKEAPATPRGRIDRSRYNMDERKVSGPRKYYKLMVSLSRLPDLSEKTRYYLTVGVLE